MVSLIKPDILIGSFNDLSKEIILEFKIGAVLSLAELPSHVSDLKFAAPFFERIILEDGPGNSVALIRRVLNKLQEFLDKAPPVLVQCHAGRSRSVAIVAGILMLREDLNFEEALQFISEKREISVSNGLVQVIQTAVRTLKAARE